MESIDGLSSNLGVNPCSVSNDLDKRLLVTVRESLVRIKHDIDRLPVEAIGMSELKTWQSDLASLVTMDRREPLAKDPIDSIEDRIEAISLEERKRCFTLLKSQLDHCIDNVDAFTSAKATLLMKELHALSQGQSLRELSLDPMS